MKKNILIMLIISGLAASCLEEIVCIDGNGQIATESRAVNEITEIVNSTSVDVTYRKADSTSIRITSESNFLDHIVTNSSGGKLEIRTDPRNACFNYSTRPVIIITSPEVRTIELTGSGSIDADTITGSDVTIRSSSSGNTRISFIKAGNLDITMTGSGNISVGNSLCKAIDFALTGSGNLEIKGSSDGGKMRLTGSGDIEAVELVLLDANVVNSGSGNIYTHVQSSLDAVITGSGNIYLRGNPSIKKSISGSGKIINF